MSVENKINKVVKSFQKKTIKDKNKLDRNI